MFVGFTRTARCRRPVGAPTGSNTKSPQPEARVCALVDGTEEQHWRLFPLRDKGFWPMLRRPDYTAEVIDRPYNNLLRQLNADDYALSAPHLSLEETEANDLLYSPGDNVGVVHFPCGASLASFLVTNEDGRDVEPTLRGREGAVGGIVSQGFLPAYTRINVKFGGLFARLPIGRLDAAKTESKTLRNVFTRYADCMLAQIFQSN